MEAHDSPSGGHFGINKTLAKIRKQFYWVNCKSSVEEWCKKCKICFAKKGPHKKVRGKFQIYNSGFPFERLAIDILGPLPKSRSGNRYILVIVDYFSRWPEAIPLPDFKATTVAEALVSHVISRFGIPLELHSDQGRNFESEIFKETMKLLGIHKTRTTPLHPESNGMVERLNRTLIEFLAKHVSTHQKDWDQWVPLFLMAYRSSKHETTEYTPARLMLGRELRLPLDLLHGQPPQEIQPSSIPEFVEEMQEEILNIHEETRNRLKFKNDKLKSRFDIKSHMVSFNPGQKIWFYIPHRAIGKCEKLQSNWEGPYEIKNKINEVVYRMKRIPNGMAKVVHVNRIFPFIE